MTGTLAAATARIAAGARAVSTAYAVVPMDPAQAEGLAALYLASYPADVGAADLAEARVEVAATFAGEYGDLLPAASLTALSDGVPVGSVQVVRRSPWDPDLDCPFVIELFVHPNHRGRGLARHLMTSAAAACAAAGETRLALRVGDGTSEAAHRLYAALGLEPVSPPR